MASETEDKASITALGAASESSGLTSINALYAASENSGLAGGPLSVSVARSTEEQLLSPFTVVCIILNQTIGAGIFVVPVIVLQSTNSVGISLLLWTAGGIISICGLLVWLEWAMSVPKYEVPTPIGGSAQNSEQPSMQCVPRSGGEKNYLEHAFGKSFPRTTCTYGILFIILGNLSGNAMQFGIYIVQAAYGTTDQMNSGDSAARGLAVACFTVTCLLHGTWRKGGIVLMNVLTILKVIFLIAMIVMGFAAAAGAKFPHNTINGKDSSSLAGVSASNFDTNNIFNHPGKDFATYSNAVLFILFTFSGYQQPFYVLNEIYRPRKYFVKSALLSMGIIFLLFTLTNIAYLCVVPPEIYLSKSNSDSDMARMFFGILFGHFIPDRVISALLAGSVFGTILTTTFTAARVKQEIAAEGILPYSLFFAKSVMTPAARLRRLAFGQGELAPTTPETTPETTPAGALFLHWAFAVLLIGCTSVTSPSTSSILLTSLYRYSTILLIGFFVAVSLVFLHFKSSALCGKVFGVRGDWSSSAGLRVWGGPTAAVIYTSATAFLIASTWAPPTAIQSPFAGSTLGFPWYTVPATCVGVVLLGYGYYLWLAIPLSRWRGKVMVLERTPYIIRDSHGEYVQVAETLTPIWLASLSKSP